MRSIGFSQDQSWEDHSIRNGNDSTACGLGPGSHFNSTETRTCSTWATSTRLESSHPAIRSRPAGLPRHPRSPTNRPDCPITSSLKSSIEPKARFGRPTFPANRPWRSSMVTVHSSFRHGSSRFEAPSPCSTSWRAEASSASSEPSIPRSSGKSWRNSSTMPAIDLTISPSHQTISRRFSARSSSGSRALRSARP